MVVYDYRRPNLSRLLGEHSPMLGWCVFSVAMLGSLRHWRLLVPRRAAGPLTAMAVVHWGMPIVSVMGWALRPAR